MTNPQRVVSSSVILLRSFEVFIILSSMFCFWFSGSKFKRFVSLSSLSSAPFYSHRRQLFKEKVKKAS